MVWCAVTDKMVVIRWRVYFLDETEQDFTLPSGCLGKELFHNVCKHLDLVETDYFGLRFNDIWIRPDKPVKKQLAKEKNPVTLKFGVKHYPSDPSYVREEITKYQLCLQVRDDILTGALPCPAEHLSILSSYWLQSELGDNEAESEDVQNCLKLLSSASQENAMTGFDEKVIELYDQRKGMAPGDADAQFLRMASELPLYGVHHYTLAGKQSSNTAAKNALGISAGGILQVGSQEFHPWSQIKNVDHDGSKFILKLVKTKDKKRKVTIPFKLQSAAKAKAVWRDAVDQHEFYKNSDSRRNKVAKSDSIVKQKFIRFSFFKKKDTKTEIDARNESASIQRPNPKVVRTSSLKRAASVRSLQSVAAADAEKVVVIHEVSKEVVHIKEEKTVEIVIEQKSSSETAVEEKKEEVIVEEKNTTSVIEKEFTSGPLLLTETIDEEDEDKVSDDEDVIQVSPKITIDSVSETSSVKSVEVAPRVSLTVPKSNLSAPLVRQRTLDAMQVKKTEETEFSFIDDSDDTSAVTEDVASPITAKPTNLDDLAQAAVAEVAEFQKIVSEMEPPVDVDVPKNLTISDVNEESEIISSDSDGAEESHEEQLEIQLGHHEEVQKDEKSDFDDSKNNTFISEVTVNVHDDPMVIELKQDDVMQKDGESDSDNSQLDSFKSEVTIKINEEAVVVELENEEDTPHSESTDQDDFKNKIPFPKVTIEAPEDTDAPQEVISETPDESHNIQKPLVEGQKKTDDILKSNTTSDKHDNASDEGSSEKALSDSLIENSQPKDMEGDAAYHPTIKDSKKDDVLLNESISENLDDGEMSEGRASDLPIAVQSTSDILSDDLSATNTSDANKPLKKRYEHLFSPAVPVVTVIPDLEDDETWDPPCEGPNTIFVLPADLIKDTQLSEQDESDRQSAYSDWKEDEVAYVYEPAVDNDEIEKKDNVAEDPESIRERIDSDVPELINYFEGISQDISDNDEVLNIIRNSIIKDNNKTDTYENEGTSNDKPNESQCEDKSTKIVAAENSRFDEISNEKDSYVLEDAKPKTDLSDSNPSSDLSDDNYDTASEMSELQINQDIKVTEENAETIAEDLSNGELANEEQENEVDVSTVDDESAMQAAIEAAHMSLGQISRKNSDFNTLFLSDADSALDNAHDFDDAIPEHNELSSEGTITPKSLSDDEAGDEADQYDNEKELQKDNDLSQAVTDNSNLDIKQEPTSTTLDDNNDAKTSASIENVDKPKDEEKIHNSEEEKELPEKSKFTTPDEEETNIIEEEKEIPENSEGTKPEVEEINISEDRKEISKNSECIESDEEKINIVEEEKDIPENSKCTKPIEEERNNIEDAIEILEQSECTESDEEDREISEEKKETPEDSECAEPPVPPLSLNTDLDLQDEDTATVGGISHVAVFGDDAGDENLQDFPDDENQSSSSSPAGSRHKSEITPSVASSWSDLTENTEDLCDPEILKRIMSRIGSVVDSEESFFETVFGVKLRKRRGRMIRDNDVKSISSIEEMISPRKSIGTQMPSPPMSSEFDNYSVEFEAKQSKKMSLPSWPLEDYFKNAGFEFDELDEMAIRACIEAQWERKKNSSIDDIQLTYESENPLPAETKKPTRPPTLDDDEVVVEEGADGELLVYVIDKSEADRNEKPLQAKTKTPTCFPSLDDDEVVVEEDADGELLVYVMDKSEASKNKKQAETKTPTCPPTLDDDEVVVEEGADGELSIYVIDKSEGNKQNLSTVQTTSLFPSHAENSFSELNSSECGSIDETYHRLADEKTVEQSFTPTPFSSQHIQLTHDNTINRWQDRRELIIKPAEEKYPQVDDQLLADRLRDDARPDSPCSSISTRSSGSFPRFVRSVFSPEPDSFIATHESYDRGSSTTEESCFLQSSEKSCYSSEVSSQTDCSEESDSPPFITSESFDFDTTLGLLRCTRQNPIETLSEGNSGHFVPSISLEKLDAENKESQSNSTRSDDTVKENNKADENSEQASSVADTYSSDLYSSDFTQGTTTTDDDSELMTTSSSDDADEMRKELLLYAGSEASEDSTALTTPRNSDDQYFFDDAATTSSSVTLEDDDCGDDTTTTEDDSSDSELSVSYEVVQPPPAFEIIPEDCTPEGSSSNEELD